MKVPIAVEIGDKYLKLIAARPAPRAKGPEFFVKLIQGFKDEDIAKAFKDTLAKSGWKLSSAIINLPRNLVTMRNLHLPSHDQGEISQMIELHVGRIVPYKKEEISFDHTSLRTDSLGYTAEMLAIVHNDILRKYQRIVEAAGLEIDGIFLSSYGAWQLVVNRFKSEVNADDLYLLLEMDSNYTDFIIFNKDNILFSRTLVFEIKDVIANSELNKFIGEVKQSLLIFHKNESINKKPSAIFISGIFDASVHDLIKKEFDVPVTIVPNPIGDAEMLKKSGIPPDASLTAVADFALEEKGKRLSFALPEMLVRRALREKTKDLTILGVLLFYVFMAATAFVWGSQYHKMSYLKKLMHRNKLIELDIGNLVDQYKRITFVKNVIYERKKPMLLLNEIEKLVPPEIIITYILIEKNDSVTLRGQGMKLSDVFRFVTTLENSKYLKEVSTKYTKTKKVRDHEVTDFEITFMIAPSKK